MAKSITHPVNEEIMQGMDLIIRIRAFFFADRGGGKIGIIVAGKKNRIIAKLAKTLKAFVKLFRVSAGKITAAAGADKKCVACD